MLLSGSLLDSFAHFCLKFGHITFILPIVVVCMIFHKRDIYAKATCFLFWVMIFNTLLKYSFKVPLFPHLGNGYAFPSGHMHAAAIFYGYILYQTNDKRIKTALAALLCCLGSSLIYCHFHDLFDILGAIAFAAAEIFVYHVLSKNFQDKVIGIIAIISSIAIMVALNMMVHKVEFHIWLAFYGLVGMEASLFFIEDVRPEKMSAKFLALILSIIMIAAVYFAFKFFAFHQYYLSEIRMALIPIIITGLATFSAKLKLEM